MSVSPRHPPLLPQLLAASIALSPTGAAATEDIEALLLDETVETVLTPARLQQPIADAPASVTVITHETLQRLQVRSVAEALRLVPGMIVAQASGNEYRISYHGTNGLIPRRMQVLVDGVSVYRSGIAQVDWVMLPVAVEDIARIEVTRSPSAAAYGANAFSAVVNIITRPPQDAQGAAVQARAGSIETADLFARLGGRLGAASYRVSLTHQADAGFDENYLGEERRDSSEFTRLGMRLFIPLPGDSSLDLQAGLSDALLRSEFADANQLSFPDRAATENNLSATWTGYLSAQHKLQIKAYRLGLSLDRDWRSCYPTILFSDEMRAMHAANPAYAAAIVRGQLPSGGSAQDDALAQAVFARMAALGAQALAPTCGEVNEDYRERKYDLEIEDTYVFSERLRTVLGAGLRRDWASSETFFNGEADSDSARLFGSAELGVTERALLNLGGMWEHEERLGDGTQFSPRAALNLRLHPGHTLRLVHARAIRTPDLLETERNWNYRARNLDPPYAGQSQRYFYYRAGADAPLRPEEIEANEISYYASLDDAGLSWDIKLFEERLSNLISEKLQFFDYHPSNASSARLQGIELQLDYRPDPRLYAYLAYAYIDNSSTNVFERSLHARHSGAAFASYRLDHHWTTGAAYFGNSAIGGFSSDRFELSLAKTQRLGARGHLRGALLLRYYGNLDNGFIVSEGFSVKNIYDHRLQYFVTLRYDH